VISYTIYFRFRGRGHTATVHKYETFSFVYINDSKTIIDITGQHEFDKNNKPVNVKANTPADIVDFHRAISDQLR
jgi:hypothetical protein